MINFQAFQNFMNHMKGQDPNQIIQQMVQSGKVSQSQLNYAQMQAAQMESEFANFRKMFGF